MMFKRLFIHISNVKATSVIFFLGFGSFVCYKLYRYYQKDKNSKLWASDNDEVTTLVGDGESSLLFDICHNNVEADVGSPQYFYGDSECEENGEELWANSDHALLNAFFETDSEVVVSELPKRSAVCLTRNRSFDSTGSDASVEISFREDIGINTMTTLDQLLASVDRVKQSCLNLDVNIDQLKGHGLLSKTEFPKLLDANDVSGSQSAQDFVDKYKTRASFRGFLGTGAGHICWSDSSKLENSSEQSSLHLPARCSSQWMCSKNGFIEEDQQDLASVHHRNKNLSISALNGNRDSAFCEGVDIGFSRIQENIGEKWELIQYSETEWQGHTTRAETIRKGYAHIPSSLNCFHLWRIRGDNYCAVRTALFQVLQLGLPFLDSFDGHKSVCQKLESWAGKCTWLSGWSFGSRLPYSNSTCVQGFAFCLASLDRLSSISRENVVSRKEILVDQFNSDADLQLMEGVKLLMFIRSTQLYEQITAGCDVPVFAVRLFARETSRTPKQLMENHLNLVGDSAGLEKVEMCLLGDTLGVTLRVLRPSSFGNEDYICYYPEKTDDIRPEVNLIAEDDRCYNIILT